MISPMVLIALSASTASPYSATLSVAVAVEGDRRY